MGTLTAEKMLAMLHRGSSARLADSAAAPRFRLGERVIALNLHPRGHTRLPRYVRGHSGVIHRDHGVFIFPDSHAAHGDQAPQHVYSVRFSAQELWGHQAPAQDAIYVDLWDDYLQTAEAKS